MSSDLAGPFSYCFQFSYHYACLYIFYKDRYSLPLGKGYLCGWELIPTFLSLRVPFISARSSSRHSFFLLSSHRSFLFHCAPHCVYYHLRGKLSLYVRCYIYLMLVGPQWFLIVQPRTSYYRGAACLRCNVSEKSVSLFSKKPA